MNRRLAALLALISLPVSYACGAGDTGQPAQAGWIADDLDSALALAGETGRPVLLDLYADWCGPCRTLGEEYFTSPEMQEVLGRFILARADVDGSEGSVLAARFGADAIPCVVILSPDGTEISRIVGLTPTVAEYRTRLEEILAGI